MENQRKARIAVYVDGYNLYYGGKKLINGSSWKWLDIRKLVESLLPKSAPWFNGELVRILYFTAEVNNAPETLRRQQAYVEALRISGLVDYVVFGKFKSFKDENFAVTGYYKRFDYVQMQTDPLPEEKWVKLDSEKFVRVSHLRNEEKGTDVNIASHILIDLLTNQLDALIIITNDDDLYFPIRYAREHVPVSVINPRGGRTVSGLKGSPSEGVGSHWWYSLSSADLLDAQLPDEIDGIFRSEKWR